MKARRFNFRYPVIAIVVISIFSFITFAGASAQEIHSITPNMGSSDGPTQVTISGTDFFPTPKTALYGGGAYTIGSWDNEWSSPSKVYVQGIYAYVADRKIFKVIDISDPENSSLDPSIVGSCETPTTIRDVYIQGVYACVTNDSLGLYVIDISAPTTPNIVGSCDTPGTANGVYIQGSYAYVADCC